MPRRPSFLGSASYGFNSDEYDQLRQCREYNAKRAAYHRAQISKDPSRASYHENEAIIYGRAARVRGQEPPPPPRKLMYAHDRAELREEWKKQTGFGAFLKSLFCCR